MVDNHGVAVASHVGCRDDDAIGGDSDGFCKVLRHAESGELLGVHMVGPKVTDLIAEASLAMELGATAGQVGGTTHPHPTLSEIVGEAALVSLGRSVNF